MGLEVIVDRLSAPGAVIEADEAQGYGLSYTDRPKIVASCSDAMDSNGKVRCSEIYF